MTTRVKQLRWATGLAGLGAAMAGVLAWTMAPTAQAGVARPHAPERPQRIVSLNLCSDQYLLALADPGQIAGLTRYATDPDMSAAAAKTHGLRILGTSAEEILTINPDLLVGMPARRSLAIGILAKQDYPALDLKTTHSYADILAQTRKVARAVGHPQRGEALIARMNRALAALPRNGRGRVAAYYQRRGYLTGTGTLVDDLMQRAGLVNLATKLGKSSVSRLSIEELVAARPDVIILEAGSGTVRDQGTEMLNHPALRGIPRIYIPQALTVCGGPAYVDAARTLAEQLGRS